MIHGAHHNMLFLIVFGVCGNDVAVYGDADSIMKSLPRGSLLLLGDFTLSGEQVALINEFPGAPIKFRLKFYLSQAKLYF